MIETPPTLPLGQCTKLPINYTNVPCKSKVSPQKTGIKVAYCDIDFHLSSGVAFLVTRHHVCLKAPVKCFINVHTG